MRYCKQFVGKGDLQGGRGNDASFIHIHKVLSLVLVLVSICEKKNIHIDI